MALHRKPNALKKMSLIEKDRLWDYSLAYILWCGIEGLSGFPDSNQLIIDGRDGFPKFSKLLDETGGVIRLQEIINKGWPRFLEHVDTIIRSRPKSKSPKPEEVQDVASLDEEHGDDGSSLFDIIAVHNTSPEESVVRNSTRRKIETYIDRLEPGESEIISMLYGFQGHTEHSYGEVAVTFNLTLGQIRKTEKSVLRKLRIWMHQDGLGASSL